MKSQKPAKSKKPAPRVVRSNPALAAPYGGLQASTLEAQYGVWGEHPEHPAADWRYDVSNCDTRRGYWAWVVDRIENKVPIAIKIPARKKR